MPNSNHLLERARQLIATNQLKNAELVLDAIVRVDPQNMEAWKIYLMICHRENDLNWLRDRILKTVELGRRDKVELIDYSHWLVEQSNCTEETVSHTYPLGLFPQDEERDVLNEETFSQFEVVDVFDYPPKTIKNNVLSRPISKKTRRIRRRAYYNPFSAMISPEFLKTVLRKTTLLNLNSFFERAIGIANDFVKRPKETWAVFSKSPYFKTYYGVFLLALFILSIRILTVNSFWGYLLLGTFVLGSWQWWSKYGSYNPSQTRIYPHEIKSDLSSSINSEEAVIREVEVDKEI